MFNIKSIIRNNNATFYDFDTRRRRSQKPKVVVLTALSVALAVLCPKVSDNLLAGFLAVQSILLGFTFNVMFFLVGHNEDQGSGPQSIEGQLRTERINTLYHELFYNVSYFNVVAVASIIVATVLLLPTMEAPSFLQHVGIFWSYLHWISTSTVPMVIGTIFHDSLMFVFYWLACEVVFSVARVIGRTSFYFERKMGGVPPLDR